MVEEWAATAPALDVRDLQVMGRLLRVAEHGRRAVAAALEPFGLSHGDFDVLNTLRRRGDPGGTHPRVLAASALITSGAMTTRLDRLEARGLLVRGADPDDRRSLRIQLTPEGRELVTRALDAVLAADAAFLEPLDGPARDSLTDGLRVLLSRHEARPEARHERN
jgi:DNA-binding MarR family transcriptional regulator